MLNKVDSDLTNLCVTCNTKTADGKSSNFKIASWNVAGIRACIKVCYVCFPVFSCNCRIHLSFLLQKNGIEYVMKELPDVLCVQEVKCSESKLPSEVEIEGYHAYWCLGIVYFRYGYLIFTKMRVLTCSNWIFAGSKEGYAGVGLYSKIKPLNVVNGIDKPEYDSEGRVITAEYEDFFLINTCMFKLIFAFSSWIEKNSSFPILNPLSPLLIRNGTWDGLLVFYVCEDFYWIP